MRWHIDQITFQGRLEEYKALREEMLSIISSRLWGQATYVLLAGGIFSFAKEGCMLKSCLIFLIFASIPFLSHTKFREDSRIRMAIYLRDILEPAIPGLYWEKYLENWRRTKNGKSEGWLSKPDRKEHIFSIAGIYFVVSFFCYALLWKLGNFIEIIIGSLGLMLLLIVYRSFYNLYSKTNKQTSLVKVKKTTH